MAYKRPGVNTVIREEIRSTPAPTTASTTGIVGLAAKGPVGVAQLVTGSALSTIGAPIPAGYSAESVAMIQSFARPAIYQSRIVGPNPVKAGVTLQNATPAATVRIEATYVGAYANAWTVVVAAGAVSGITITVKDAAGVTLEQSPDLTSEAAIVAWGATAIEVDVIDLTASGLPVVGTFTLSSGTDDALNAGQTNFDAALAAFVYELGPMQVLAPGYATTAAAASLAVHAQANRRYALCDAPDTGVEATLLAHVAAIRSLVGKAPARWGSLLAPWAVTPSSTGQKAVLPYSPVQAGIIARNDGLSANDTGQGNAPAFENGVAPQITDVTQRFSDDAVTRLTAAGVTVAKNRRGTVLTYGDRTMADVASDANWYEASDTRVLVALSWKGEAALEKLLGQNIDRNGLLESRAHSDLRSIAGAYYDAGALYGTDVDDAMPISVTADPSARRITADTAPSITPGAEAIDLNITKRAAQEA